MLGPKIHRTNSAGFDRSLSFLRVENNEMVLNVALALARDYTIPIDAELLDGTSLEGICYGMMNMGMGLVAAIPHAFEKMKTLRKELKRQERSVVICAAKHVEVVARAMVVEELARESQEKLHRSQADVDKLTYLNFSISKKNQELA